MYSSVSHYNYVCGVVEWVEILVTDKKIIDFVCVYFWCSVVSISVYIRRKERQKSVNKSNQLMWFSQQLLSHLSIHTLSRKSNFLLLTFRYDQTRRVYVCCMHTFWTNSHPFLFFKPNNILSSQTIRLTAVEAPRERIYITETV